MTTDQLETATPDEKQLDTALRPQTLDDFIGQTDLVRRLRLWLRAAIEREEPLDHCLFAGPPGLGKTTLALLIATHTGARLYTASGPAIERPADLLGTLTRLQKGDVLFVDEVHRLPRACEEYLYTAMEDWRVDVTTEKNGTISIPLQRFTLVGATTRAGMLTGPFRARFGISERLEPYDVESLTAIIRNSAAKLGLSLDDAPARSIARRCRGTPRISNKFLARLRDLVQVNKTPKVTVEIADGAAQILGLDAHGLNAIDRRILQALETANGRPVGLTALGQIVNEEPRTIEDNHEPYLTQQGYVIRTPKGRMITDAGRAALNGGIL